MNALAAAVMSSLLVSPLIAYGAAQDSEQCESIVMASASNDQDVVPVPKEQLRDLLRELGEIDKGLELGTVKMQGRVFKRHPYCVKCVTGREAGRCKTCTSWMGGEGGRLHCSIEYVFQQACDSGNTDHGSCPERCP